MTGAASNNFELLERIPLYVPGKPIQEVKREYGLDHIIKLASNENPWGPTPAVKAKIIDAVNGTDDEGVGLYPVSDGFYLRKAISECRRIKLEQIVLGNGSAEIIEMAAKACFIAGGSAVIPRHSFAIGGISVQTAGGRIIETHATATEVDVEAILKAIEPDTKMVYIANANNPTGVQIGRDGIAMLVKEIRDDILLVVDQAYAEYSEPGDFPDAANYLGERENLLVLHTFSKIYALASLRIGYGLGNERMITLMERVRSPFNTNHIAQVAAEVAIRDKEFVAFCREKNRQARDAFFVEAAKHRCTVSSNAGNFVLLETAIPAPDLFQYLLKKSVIVRPMHGYGLPMHMRITLGRPEEMEAFWAAAAPILV
uniref:Histidinol-phosphate aminotransferase n=1 Tax=uncultured bacterium contig00038 TaxID=1181526 RepID=A0A806KK81_9BACT|nr:biosynthetic Aromatic amino acid aminotransferase beta @ histidinol-phosphate aminotransferase [uncultured bacterium contig00038]